MTWDKMTKTRENAQRLTRMSMKKEESKKTTMKIKTLSRSLCSVQADLSRYQKRQNCINLEDDKSANEIELCYYNEM